MTVVNPKSISGINSITMASGGDDLLTIHSNNTTERVRVNNSGDVIIGSGVTLSPDGDVFATGVTTSTTFVGGLTGNVTGNVTGNISGGTVAGSTGTFTGDVDIADKIIHTGDTNTAIRFPAADTITAETDGTERYRITSDGKFVGGPLANGHSTARCAAGGLDLRAGQGGAGFPSIKIGADSETANATTLSSSTRKQARIGCASYHNSYDFATFLYFDSDTSTNELNIGGGTGHGYAATNISLWTAANNTTSTGTERMRVHSGGTVNIPSGITLGETANSTAASNTLDDYEEGTFTPAVTSGLSGGAISYNSRSGHYTKIGRMVYFTFHINLSSASLDDGAFKFGGLPFTSANDTNQAGGAFFNYSTGNFGSTSTFKVVGNSTDLQVITAAGDATAANTTSFNTNNRQVSFSGFYRV